jgi:hypothetical protein
VKKHPLPLGNMRFSREKLVGCREGKFKKLNKLKKDKQINKNVIGSPSTSSG